MSAVVIQIRDFHLKRLVVKGAKGAAQVIDHAEVARLGGPITPDSSEMVQAGLRSLADTSSCEMIPYHAPDKDPA